MIFLEHVVVMVEVALSYMLEKVPKGVQSKIAQEKLERKTASVNERLAMYQFIGKATLEDRILDAAENKATAKKIESNYSTRLGFNPYILLGFVFAPLLFANMGISQIIIMPICFLYFSYIKNRKDRQDAMAAAGIICDDNVRQIMCRTSFFS